MSKPAAMPAVSRGTLKHDIRFALNGGGAKASMTAMFCVGPQSKEVCHSSRVVVA